MDHFATLTTDARAFFKALNLQNTRDWWLENKANYDEKLKAPALVLLDQLTPELEKLTGEKITTKLFRPHRDVRFSKDKTPYNTHLHMMWQLQSTAPQNPVFFFGVGLDYITAGAGIMGFDKSVLVNWRKMVDLDTDRILRIVSDVQGEGFALREPALKRVPQPFPADHRAALLLRMKGCVASTELSPGTQLPDQLMQAFRNVWPLNALLLSIAEA